MAKKKFSIKMKQSWFQIAEKWREYNYPVKPSPMETRFFEKEIKDLLKREKRIKALVLGATPEFRDLLAKHKIDTVLIDNNLTSVKAMTFLMKRKTKKEKIVVGDWLKMPFKENTFDIVFSDSAQDNIKFKNFNKFFNNVYQILKPEGYWFFAAVNVEKNQSISLKKYIKKYKEKPKIFKDFRNFASYFFRVGRGPDFYKPKTRSFDFAKIDQRVKALIEEGKISSKALKDICFHLNYEQVLIGQTDFKKMLKKNFNIFKEMKKDKHPGMEIKWAAILKPKK